MTRRFWFPRLGDFNGFVGLLVDNAAALLLFFTLLAAPGFRVDRLSPSFVLTWMIPGTVAGVLVGGALCSFLALRLARRSGRTDVTAMPVGLDTPSCFVVPLFVILPALAEGRELFSSRGLAQIDLHHLASVYAWHVGLAVLVMLGLLKVALAPLGNKVRKLFPRAALLGSLASVSLALIAFLPLARHIAPAPVIGIPVLMILLVMLLSPRGSLIQFPAAALAIGVGMMMVVISVIWGPAIGIQWAPLPDATLTTRGWSEPLPAEAWNTDWWQQVLWGALGRLPVALPFAVFTVLGGVQCTESAAASGDEYDARGILLTQGIATTAAGLLGGVVQTTPYFGHPAYKKMGAGWAYVSLCALVLVALGYLGWFSDFFQWIPGAVVFPLIVYVGLQTIAHSFQVSQPRDYAAMAFAGVPVLAYLIFTTADEIFASPRSGHFQGELLQALRCLGNGFILTSLLWATAAAALLDDRPISAIPPLLIAAVCSLFGLIHSPLAGAPLAWPTEVWAQLASHPNGNLKFQSPYHWCSAYLLACAVVLIRSYVVDAKQWPARQSGKPGEDSLALDGTSTAPSAASSFTN